MRVLVLLAVIAQGGAEVQQGSWIAVETTARSVSWLDTAIRAAGDGLIDVRSKHEYSIPMTDRQEMFDTRVLKYRIRCADPARSMVLEEALYKGTSLIRRTSTSAARRRWFSLRPNSWNSVLIQKACLLAQEQSKVSVP